MLWCHQHAVVHSLSSLLCLLLLWCAVSSMNDIKQREKRVAVLASTELPAASVDLAAFNLTDLVNGMFNTALKGAQKFFSFLSITSYSSFAFHKVTILIYNISNIKNVDHNKFPMRYCYCLTNRTNDLTDFTALLLDIVGNSTSYLKEIFKSTSIVSVSQSNESDCIYFCVMTGRTGRNLSDLWELTQKSPVINYTFPRNDSGSLDVESVLPSLITTAEDIKTIMGSTVDVWTLKTTSVPFKEEHIEPETRTITTLAMPWEESIAAKGSVVSVSSVPSWTQTFFPVKPEGFPTSTTLWEQSASLTVHDTTTKGVFAWTTDVASKEQKIFSMRIPSGGQDITFDKLEISTKIPPLPQDIAAEGQKISSTGLTTRIQVASSKRPNLFAIPASTQAGTITPKGHELLMTHRTIWVENDILEKYEMSTTSKPLLAKTLALNGHKISITKLPMWAEDVGIGEHDLSVTQMPLWAWDNTVAPKGYEILSTKVPPWVENAAFEGNDISVAKKPFLDHSTLKTTFNFPTKASSTPGIAIPQSATSESKIQMPGASTNYPLTGSLASRPQSLPTEEVKPPPFTYTHSRKVEGQESGASPVVPNLSDVPLRNINNFTFFNGVFKNLESVTLFFDCLGSHFTWLQSIFTNFPALLNFVNKLKCVTGLCPKDLDNYGCTCRFEMEGLPIDASDSCCFQHRKCYEDAMELECNWNPAKITTDISCLTKNLTCVSADPCERLLCNCDKAAIECFVHSPVNLSMRNLDTSLCLAPVTEVTDRRGVTTPDTEVTPAEETMTSTARITPSDLENMVSRIPKVGDHSTDPNELGYGTLEIETTSLPTPEQSSFTEEAMSIGSVGTAEGISTEKTTMKTTGRESVFKMAEESTVQSPLVPIRPPTEEGAVEKVCERFTFLQLGENGNFRREVPQLGEMLFCLSGRCPQEFESYGCYCGHEGKGDPTDALDRCCFTHHCCLEHLKTVGCPPERIARSEVICVDQKPKCMATSICDKLMCSCNKAAAECMAEAPINETMRSLNRRQCQEGRVICRHGVVQERPLGATGADTMSSSSEESSEEPSPIRDARRPLETRPGAAPLRARQPHSRARGK